MGEVGIIVLNEINQCHKDKYQMFLLICGSQGIKKKKQQTTRTHTQVMKVKGRLLGGGRKKGGGGDEERVIVHYKYVWKCHDEILLCTMEYMSI
jgi:hypothetical protein